MFTAVTAILAADEALRTGDSAQAIAALDQRVVWTVWDRQALSRLAEAYLSIERDDGAFRFRKRRALAVACACTYPLLRSHLLLGSRMWSEERMEDVLRRARAWLEDRGG